MEKRRRHPVGTEKGTALVTSLMLIVILGMMATVAMNVSSNESHLAAKTRGDAAAFSIAEAGLEHGWAVLNRKLQTQSIATILTSNKNTSTNQMVNVVSKSAVVSATTSSSFPKIATNLSFAGGKYYVFVANDPAETVTTTTDSNNVITLTSIGYASNGTYTVLQTSVKYNGTAALPGAVTLPGIYSEIETEQEHGGTIGVNVNSSLYPTTSQIAYNSANGTPSELSGPISATGKAMSPPFDSVANFKNYYNQLMASAKSAGTYYNNSTNYTSTSTPNPNYNGVAPAQATSAFNPAVPGTFVVNGDLTLGGTVSGSGILVISGNLHITGNFTWNGLVIIAGDLTTTDITLDPSGNKTININGGLVAAKLNGDIENPATNAWMPVEVELEAENNSSSINVTYNPTTWNSGSSGSVKRVTWRRVI